MTASRDRGGGLRVRGLSAAYNGAPVLVDVDVDVGPGEWLGVIGPNGAGKTTMLRAIAGAVPATGEVLVSGVAVGELPQRLAAQRIAVVPQDPVIPTMMPVLDYVLAGRTPFIPYWGRESSEDLDVVSGVMARLDLNGFERRAMGSLSGGERQRAVLARALAQQADLLLLDEPTSALDLGHQQQVLELVDGLRLDRGIAVISAMHDLTLAGQFPDRLMLLDGGVGVAAGPPHQVLTVPLLRRHFGAEVTVIADGAGGLVVAPLRRSGEAGVDEAADPVGDHSADAGDDEVLETAHDRVRLGDPGLDRPDREEGDPGEDGGPGEPDTR